MKISILAVFSTLVVCSTAFTMFPSPATTSSRGVEVILMSKHAVAKGAKKMHRSRPRKTRPSDINRKPTNYNYEVGGKYFNPNKPVGEIPPQYEVVEVGPAGWVYEAAPVDVEAEEARLEAGAAEVARVVKEALAVEKARVEAEEAEMARVKAEAADAV